MLTELVETILAEVKVGDGDELLMGVMGTWLPHRDTRTSVYRPRTGR